ncbi:protein TolB [Blastomonas marina]|uniref:Tol-Pal system protein TolB n=1 Tax=Blastomonas marina TaxID=1867408 RepID=A0ABQ1F3T8_9SPHN|nr:Tol-Pal system beta propeller repeat protein TolB [Blastomonas marina]GFZ98497.1 protein TolB [Blastomonas marina]
MKFAALLMTAAFSLAAIPAAAQQSPTIDEEPIATSQEAPQGLSGAVTDESEWQDLEIAIPGFATNANVSTAANDAGTAALGRDIARVITADLQNNGLFRPTGPDSLPQPSFGDITSPAYSVWDGRKAEMLVQGYVRKNDDDSLTVGCYLYDVLLKQPVEKAGWRLPPSDWRRAAHKCADMVFSRLTGENPFFDSRIAYIAETGPKDNRRKRLAIMDSDGANHRFLTSGNATALSPRYSPDYKQILYLSYLDGNPRIYIYDIASGTQKLIAQSENPTFAPRWSPDGRWVLYSMAVAGNTDIYRVSADGGESVRLTSSPGIDVGGSFSPDGKQIVFESDRSGSQQIYVMDADGSDQRRISFFGGRAATPEWSPRGDQIAFTHISGNFRIATMSPNGKNMRHLTNSWQDEAPTWAPNGRIIQFFRTQRNSGETSIWQVDLTGRNERRLTTPVDGSDPAWGPIRD